MFRFTLLALTAVLALLLSGCGVVGTVSAPTVSQAPVEVTGAAGQEPSLTYEQPLDITRPGTRTIWPGTGDRLVEGGPVLLNLYAQDGRDGSVVQSTFADAPAWRTMSVASLGANLHEALQGSRVGARLLFLEEQDGLPLVLVIDVLPTRASGEPVAPREGQPTVVLDADGAPTITVPEGADPPTDLLVQPLVRGSGPQVEVGEVVTVRFTGVRWSDGTVFDTTWDTPHGAEAVQSVMIGIGQVVDGWDQGLLEQTVGSQILLVVPPSLGYGGTSSPLADQTLVYVVDILDAHYQVTEAGAGAGAG
ncbi:peptidylprolyl isomerase FKBP-type [Xylanimonas cellulosilytica DSM 15894]|uniref:Peptidyl-prolyl cis-trans isomerase n=1 Tax=Xylanimonas cellulosilytica (strain DSM 15894 / JCM 12276 / CECT 5975 / KCTC 9989 / LMG 20990 / NBRC 107835 / XIL07) TaxID=446471 RepID=D1BS29_XYLCX|nr:FKBP-type peptidyl-prolyl cis-trans isomerase [Xylanimonas cellulosilytica]ACZ30521.1 peptidylprolyl isomerase FKBP-type [Xylanimonas cellulosilytica DSM 15894]